MQGKQTAEKLQKQIYRPPSRGSGTGMHGLLTPGKGRSRAGSRLGSPGSGEGSATHHVDEVHLLMFLVLPTLHNCQKFLANQHKSVRRRRRYKETDGFFDACQTSKHSKME